MSNYSFNISISFCCYNQDFYSGERCKNLLSTDILRFKNDFHVVSGSTELNTSLKIHT